MGYVVAVISVGVGRHVRVRRLHAAGKTAHVRGFDGRRRRRSIRIAVGIFHRERELVLRALAGLGSTVIAEVARLAVQHERAAVREGERIVPVLSLHARHVLPVVQAHRHALLAVSTERHVHGTRHRLAVSAGRLRIHTDRRHVVHHVHRDGTVDLGTVHIRHRHGQVMGNLRVRSRIAFVVFRGVPVERIAEIQLARDRVIARHGQGAFICGHNVAGQLAVCKNHHVADDDGSHAVRGVDG